MSLKKKDDLNSLSYYLYNEVFYSSKISEIILKEKKKNIFKLMNLKMK